MRKLAIGLFALSLAALPAARAGGGPGDGKLSEKDKRNDSAATQPSNSKLAELGKPAVTSTAELASELEQLRMLLASQAKQLEEQQRELVALKSQLAHDAAAADTIAASAGTTAAAAPGATAAVAANAAQAKEAESPLAIRYKGITITPGGFLAAESVYRNRGLSADVNTPFNSVPFPFSSLSKVGENNFSGRQSRITLLGEGKLDNVKMSAYYETDWLGSGTTSNNNQTNSYVNRQRQIWGQAAFSNGITITGGQMWSLLTETKHGLDNRTEGTPLTIDAQYQVGFTWARQYGFRVTKSFGDRFWLGLSVEDSQINSVTVHTSGAAVLPPFVSLATGNNGGLFNTGNNYSLNSSPDFIVKAAWEPGWGHYEIFGIVSTFRSRLFPCGVGISAANPCPINGSTTNSAIGGNNQTVTVGGIGGNVRVPLFSKKLDVVLHAVWGDGTGRYGTTGLADATIHPNGSIEPIRDGQAMVGLEFHPTPAWDIYGYGGAEYVARTWYRNAAGTGQIGYGAPALSAALPGFNNAGCFTELLGTTAGLATTSTGTCTGDTRYISEGTIGFWRRMYQGPKGRLQFGLQYSYVTRSAWSGAGGEPHGPENMVFTSFRYYLP